MRWPRRAAGLVTIGVWLALPALAVAATPTPDPVGDPRSPGQGPGLVGDPLLAIAAVVAIGILALVATLAYVRSSGGPASGER